MNRQGGISLGVNFLLIRLLNKGENMKYVYALVLMALTLVAAPMVFAQLEVGETISNAVVADQKELSQFIYSYGTVLKVSPTEIVLQEYDYDSDVEKEVIYSVDVTIKIEGFKALTDLVSEDVVEVYYLEQDGKKIAKIIRREIIEEENTSPENP